MSTTSWNENSLYAKEMKRWDTPRSQGGMRPDGFEQFPRMVFKAKRPASGGPILCLDPRDEQFSSSNQFIVNNQAEWDRARDEGWRDTPQEAVAHANALEGAISMAAATRNYEDRRMSAKARAEAAAVDAASFEHVPEIKEQPLVRKPVSEDVAQKRRDSLAKARAAKAAKKNSSAA